MGTGEWTLEVESVVGTVMDKDKVLGRWVTKSSGKRRSGSRARMLEGSTVDLGVTTD